MCVFPLLMFSWLHSHATIGWKDADMDKTWLSHDIKSKSFFLSEIKKHQNNKHHSHYRSLIEIKHMKKCLFLHSKPWESWLYYFDHHSVLIFQADFCIKFIRFYFLLFCTWKFSGCLHIWTLVLHDLVYVWFPHRCYFRIITLLKFGGAILKEFLLGNLSGKLLLLACEVYSLYSDFKVSFIKNVCFLHLNFKFL